MSQDKTTILNSDTEVYRKITNSSFCIELFFHGKEFRFERDQLPVWVGRNSDECDIVIDSSTVSRQHFCLQIKDNQIGLLDQSTNGTHVKIGRADSVLIKNSFYPLASQGNISAGEPIETTPENIIYFRISPNRSKNT